MIQDIRLHGHVTNTIEYFATVAGQNISHRFFYETGSPNEDTIIRFFSPGNEFIIGKDAILYKGNGGSFCEYMFGINQPLKDMIKKEVVNRLVMYGAIYEPNLDHIYFTDQTAGSETYEEVFLHGSALANYYFFIHDAAHREVKKQQELFLKLMGKKLKHSRAVSQENDLEILHEVFNALKIPDGIIFLFKIINNANKLYYATYRQFYYDTKGINPKEYITLEKLAKSYQISKYQQERIKIDVIYKHPDNKRLIDEYKDILVELSKNPVMTSSDIARLNRLRTLSVRQNIPMEVFLTLDELFLKGKKIEPLDEPKYLSTTREILEGLFLKSHTGDIVVSKEDLIMLLRAKLEALEKRDFSFEGLLLEVGKTCDEHSKAKKDTKTLEKFGYIITFFDRCDTTYTTLNQIIFMDNTEITEKMLRTIYNNKKIFDGLSSKLFKEIFVDKVLKDRYLTEFGRKKIYALFHGLKEIEDGNFSLTDVVEQIANINQEVLLYTAMRQSIKKKMHQFKVNLNDSAQRESLIKGLTQEMIATKMIVKDIPEQVLQKVIRDLYQEGVYLQEILPKMITDPSGPLRESFLKESGLDRYYIEELEKDYFERNRLDQALLQKIQKNI
jgi:uncharacterized protein (TIGR04442 family)